MRNFLTCLFVTFLAFCIAGANQTQQESQTPLQLFESQWKDLKETADLTKVLDSFQLIKQTRNGKLVYILCVPINKAGICCMEVVKVEKEKDVSLATPLVARHTPDQVLDTIDFCDTVTVPENAVVPGAVVIIRMMDPWALHGRAGPRRIALEKAIDKDG